MRYFILFLMFSINAQGSNWISKSDYILAKSNLPGATVFSKKEKCEADKSELCINKPSDVRHKKFGFASIDPLKTLDCDDAVNCQGILDNDPLDIAVPHFSCVQFQTARFDDKANWPMMSGTGWFLWCQKEILVNDDAGKNQADLDDAIKISNKISRKGKRDQRKTDLKSCAKKSGAFSEIQRDNCIKAIAKEIMRSELLESDL